MSTEETINSGFFKKQKGTELVTRKEVKDSPFVVIGITAKEESEKKEYFGVLGNYRITETYDTSEEVEKLLKKITWNRIVQVILIISELNKTKVQ